MAIKGISDIRRLQRFGKIRTGTKVPTKDGKNMRPQETEYFVLNPVEQLTDVSGNIVGEQSNSHMQELIRLFGDKPTELPIVLPIGNKTADGCFFEAPQDMKWYAKDKNGRPVLMCKGNGEWANYAGSQNVCGMGAPGVEYPAGMNRICNPATCPHAQPEGEYKPPRCKPSMTFTFMIPSYTTFGVFAIDTSSVTAMKDLNSTLDIAYKAYMYMLLERGMIRSPSEYRGLAGVPLKLFRKKVPNSKGGFNFPLAVEVDISRLNLDMRKLESGQATTLMLADFSVEPLDESDFDPAIIAPDGNADVVDVSTGEIVGTQQEVARTNRLEQASSILQDPEVDTLFKQLFAASGRVDSEKARKATADKFQNPATQKDELVAYLKETLAKYNKTKAQANKPMDASGLV